MVNWIFLTDNFATIPAPRIAPAAADSNTTAADELSNLAAAVDSAPVVGSDLTAVADGT